MTCPKEVNKPVAKLGLEPKFPASQATVRLVMFPPWGTHPSRAQKEEGDLGSVHHLQAAARHQCSYLVGSHMAEFLQTGGDPEWLLGLHRAPEKLRKLSEINKLLAHRPWLITKEHIQVQWAERRVPEGARGPGGGMAGSPGQALSRSGLSFSLQALLKTGEHSWSLAELIQALVLLTHCHSLASFVFGCGILPEGDPEGSPAPQAPSPPSEQSTPPSRDPLNHSGVSHGPQSWWERKLAWPLVLG